MLNNFKFDYAKKYHYLIKYILMAIPLFLLILSYLFPIKQTENNYQVETTTQVNYKYQTNEVNSVDDLVVGNIYYLSFDLSNFNTDNYNHYIYFVLDYYNILNYNFNDAIISHNEYSDYVPYISLWSNGGYYISLYKYRDNYRYYYTIQSIEMVFVFSSFDNYNITSLFGISSCPIEYIPIDNTTITNTINDANAIIDSQESKVNNTAYLKPLNDFYKLGVNSWYDSLLTALNIDVDNDTTYYIYHIPLYIIYFYIFDIILDIFAIIFRLGHKLINKFGGDY